VARVVTIMLSRSQCLLLALLATTGLVGCRKASVASGEARDVCLADPSAGLPVDEAIREHQKLARKVPHKPDEWVLIGRGWVRKARRTADPGFYVNVEACATEALRVEPENIAALQLRALVLMNDHKFSDAKQVADAILLKQPGDTIALGTASDALLELGAFEEAADFTQRMISARPDMASYSRASYFRWLQGDTGAAKLFIKDALKAGRDPRDPEPTAWSFVQAGMLFFNEADYEGADMLFAEALKWVPDYAAALVGRGRVAIARNQPARAIDVLAKAYDLSPLPETAWLLGDARAASGDQRGAAAEYLRVVREGKRGDRLTLAYFYATKDRDHEEAVRLVEAERASRRGIYVEDAYAWTLFRAGRLGEAREASDRATRLGTRDARLLYHAGAIRLAQGDPAGRALVQQALAINPKFDWTGAKEASALVASSTPRESAP
jgi:tetratricopeptide (TPR) repeat protein